MHLCKNVGLAEILAGAVSRAWAQSSLGKREVGSSFKDHPVSELLVWVQVLTWAKLSLAPGCPQAACPLSPGGSASVLAAGELCQGDMGKMHHTLVWAQHNKGPTARVHRR